MTDAPLADEACAHMPLAAWFGARQVNVWPLGEGHINATYLVREVANGQESADGWVLQSLSATVFRRPQDVMANLDRLTRWVARAEQRGQQQPAFELPQPQLARDKTTLVRGGVNPRTGTSSWWRLTRYISGSRTLQTLNGAVQAEAAGRAFGEFQALVRELPAADLVPVIDGFLDLAAYLGGLDAAVESHASTARQTEEATLLNELASRRARYHVAVAAADLVVIHGDCKVNNLLFASEHQREHEQEGGVLAIVDLDTLMVGAWWLDYGDLVRSAAFSREGHFDSVVFAALAAGFFAGRGTLKAVELPAALAAPAHLAYMLCVRFLADHLNGDHYFRVEQRGENLSRAQAQFAQLLELEGAATQAVMATTLEQIVAVSN